MPSLLPDNFAAIALHAGLVEDESYFLFLQTGSNSTLDLMISTSTGTVPVWTLNTKAILDGTGNPSGAPYFYTGTSYSGDYFIDRTNWRIYYNTGIAWNTGVSIIGPTGSTGPAGSAGSTGAAGTGIPQSGLIKQILTKNTVANYDTAWVSVFDIIKDSKQYCLANYTQVFEGNLLDSNGSVATDIGSGTAYWAYRDSILVISDGSGSTPAIYEYTLEGDYVRAIALTGFYDIESIEWLSGTGHGSNREDRFLITEERRTGAGAESYIHVIYITPSTASIVLNGSGHESTLDLSASITKNDANEGLESICRDPSTGRIYFTLQRSVGTDWYLYYLNDENDSTPKTIVDLYGVTDMTQIRDMCFSRADNSIIFAGYKTTANNAVISKFSLETNTVSDIALEVTSGIGQLEGVAVSDNSDYIILTGEDSTNGADYVILKRNQFVNPFLDSAQQLKYFGSNGSNSVESKIFEGTDSSVFTESDSSQSFTPSLFKGYVTLGSGFSDEGRSIRVLANGKITITTADSTECALKMGLQTRINAGVIGGVTAANSIASNSGVSNWIYDSNISFRSGSYNCCSSLEISPLTSTGTYGKKIYLDSGAIPSVGDIDLYISAISGGVASYNYDIELYQMQIMRN